MAELAGLHVAFIAGTLGQGGAERQLFYMLKVLRDASAVPRVLVLVPGEHWEAEIRALGVDVVHVGAQPGRAKRLAAIVRALREGPVDVVQSQHFYTNIYAALAARALGVPSIGALRSDALSEVAAHPWPAGWASLRLPHVVAANSERAIANAVTLGAPRSELMLLPNVVDVAAFQGVPRIRGRDEAVHLVAIGRLVPVKRHDRFLRLVAALRACAAVEVRASLVGDGPERATLRAQAGALGLDDDAVRFVGAADDVRGILSDADVVVQTSDREGTPNVLLEAMACGRAILATAVGGVPGIVHDGRTGLLAPVDDEAALLAHARRLVTDGSLRARLARAAHDEATAHHGLPTLRRHLAVLYRRAGVRGRARVASVRADAPPRGVMHLTDSLDVGGSERMAVLLANHHAAAGRPVHLCTTRHAGRLERLVDERVHRFDIGRRFRIDIAALRRLAAYARTHRVSILHAHGTAVFTAVALTWLVPGVRVIWHVHYGRYARDGSGAGTYRLIRRWIHGVLTASDPLTDWARAHVGVPHDRVARVPNCTAAPVGTPHPMVLPGDPEARVVHVGTLQPEKDHPTLLRAFARVRARVPGAHLLLVGRVADARYAARVRAEVLALGLAHHVSFLGERLDVPAILANARIGVISSTSEGLPLALLEYGAAGLAVVTTDVGQCAAVVEHGVAGLVVPRGDASALAEALCRLLEEPATRARLGASLREVVQRHHTVAVAGRVVEDAYEGAYAATA